MKEGSGVWLYRKQLAGALRGLTGQWVVCTLAEKLLQLRRDYVKINDTSTDATEFSPCVPECL